MPQAVTLDVPAELIKARVDVERIQSITRVAVFEPQLVLRICSRSFFLGTSD